MRHFPDACIQIRQLKQSQRASELSADQTEATVLTVNTHTVCLLSTRDDRRITYTHTLALTHTYKGRATPVPDVIPSG